MPEGPIAIDDARRQHDSPLLFEQVARAVRELISARTLVAGDRAPSLRASARHLRTLGYPHWQSVPQRAFQG